MTLASAQVRVQHRKFSPMDRMNWGSVKLGRASFKPSRNTGKAREELVAV